MTPNRTLTWILGTQISLALAGCSSSDERLARFAAESTARQAEPNREIACVANQAAASHRRIMEATEQSRQQVLRLESDIQRQKTRLDAERRSLANERYRESLLAPVLGKLGLLLVASPPLVLDWYLLHGLRSAGEDDVSELLVRQLVLEERPLLSAPPSPRRLEQLPPEAEPDDSEPPPF